MIVADRDKPNFDKDGAHWPHRSASTFVEAGGLTFHAQTMGEGEDFLLLHGTGASTHSFRALMPILAKTVRVTAVDLPGHGFTETPLFTQMTLPGVAALTGAFVEAAGLKPAVIVGHSAGAAVAIRMALDSLVAPRAIVGFNASLQPYAGAAAPIFSTLARLLFVNPLTPRVFAATASRRRTEKLLTDTGSTLDAEGVGYYHTLFKKPGHVNGALAMMAGWNLAPLQEDLPQLKAQLTLVAASGDRTIPPSAAAQSAGKVAGGRVVRMKGLGHLAHEEDPEAAAAIILEAAQLAAAAQEGSGRADEPLSAPGSG
ncbi:MAG: alpha/beta fold hydrolase BchO [Pseudomonadota bacterium]